MKRGLLAYCQRTVPTADNTGEIYICAGHYNPWGRNFGRALGAKQGCSSQNALCSVRIGVFADVESGVYLLL
jgi:hypothetical protein